MVIPDNVAEFQLALRTVQNLMDDAVPPPLIQTLTSDGTRDLTASELQVFVMVNFGQAPTRHLLAKVCEPELRKKCESLWLRFWGAIEQYVPFTLTVRHLPRR